VRRVAERAVVWCYRGLLSMPWCGAVAYELLMLPSCIGVRVLDLAALMLCVEPAAEADRPVVQQAPGGGQHQAQCGVVAAAMPAPSCMPYVAEAGVVTGLSQILFQ
jgi:hypothetical protein